MPRFSAACMPAHDFCSAHAIGILALEAFLLPSDGTGCSATARTPEPWALLTGISRDQVPRLSRPHDQSI